MSQTKNRLYYACHQVLKKDLHYLSSALGSIGKLADNPVYDDWFGDVFFKNGRLTFLNNITHKDALLLLNKYQGKELKFYGATDEFYDDNPAYDKQVGVMLVHLDVENEDFLVIKDVSITTNY